MNKTSVSLPYRLLSVALLAAATLPATSVTLPGTSETTEGNGTTLVGSFFGSNTIQVQVAESELIAQGLMSGYSLQGLRLRLNGGNPTIASDATISDLEILLGQAVNTIAGMSTVFADNVFGGVLVHDGAYTFVANSMPGGGTPNAFGPAIPFSTSYVYQGGDLIVQIRRQPASVGFAIDASSNHPGVGTTYRAMTGTFAATSGTATNQFPVMQLDYAVPEPSAASLALLGLAGVGWRRWSVSRRS